MKAREISVFSIMIMLFYVGYTKAGTWTTLNVPGPAQGISGNNIVGYYCDSSKSTYRGFFYNGTAWTTLNAPGASETYANNIDGSNIVGTYYNTSGQQGFFYNGSTWTTIDVPGASMTEAYGIDGSNIVGRYCNGSQSHGFIYNGSTWTILDAPGATDGTIVFGIDGSNIIGCASNMNGFIYTIPEPATILLLTFGAIAARCKK